MRPDFKKYSDGLVPVIVQDAVSDKVLMLAYMDEEAYRKTLEENKVTFYSRSKQRIWTKGESSGNFLLVREMLCDCDNDALLIKADPVGPVCHTGQDTCFGEENGFTLNKLEQIISSRKSAPLGSSYTSSLFAAGINRIAQKVGEEAVELVIASKDEDRERFISEAADLLFHYMILLREKGVRLEDVVGELGKRHKEK